MNRFQSTLRRHITRFSILLTLAFFLVSMGAMLIYSMLFHFYRAQNYNTILCTAFTEMYAQYEAYLSGEGRTSCMRCLSGALGSASLTIMHQTFSRDASVPSNMILTDSDGVVAATSYRELRYSQKAFNDQVISNTQAADGLYNTVYYFDAAPHYVFCKPLRNDDGRLRGYLTLYLDSEQLTQSMRLLQYGGVIVSGGSAVVVAGDNAIVETLNHFHGMRNGEFTLAGKKYWMYSSEVPDYGVTVYTYVSVVSTAGYYLIFSVLMVLFFMMSLVFSNGVTKKIARHSAASVEQLHREIDIVAEQGGGTVNIQTGDEFEDIAEHINNMLGRLQELSSRNLELAQLNNEMEMRTLVAKFNPHFLYNTLESIRFAILLGVPGADQAILNLTRLLRYSIDGPQTEVTLAQDEPHILDYLNILQFRFGERFTYAWEPDAACRSCRIPKLLLQPVIENSVKYGFQGCGTVHVSITGRVEPPNTLVLTVTDNGPGISPARLAEIREMMRLSPESAEPIGHHELQSAARRLFLQYGTGSRLEVDSVMHVGTTVTMRIVPKEEHHELSGFSG
ncbi:MAG: sensor histidine kinase [Oscillospiraceae bacterium]|nr:sensor histidine kinase [Oscillospiraceae bacterium]